MRVAWIGPMPSPGGGVPSVAWLIVRELSAQGHRIDCCAVGADEYISERLAYLAGVRVVNKGSGWRWAQWYSRNHLFSPTAVAAAVVSFFEASRGHHGSAGR